MVKKKTEIEQPREATYTKEQLLRSERYRGVRDLVAALLDDGKSYAAESVDEMLKEFGEREVK